MILTEPSGISSHIDRISDVALVVGPMFWWLIRWTKRVDGSYRVAKDVSTNHLPFVYKWLRQHNDELSAVAIDHMSLPEHPNIVLVPNGSK